MKADQRQETHDARPRRRRVWPWLLLGFLGLLVLSGAVTALRVSSVSESRWKKFNTRQNELLGRLRSGDAERAPLLGEPSPGNAWDGYFTALKGMETLTESERDAAGEAARAPVPGSTASAPKPERVELAMALLERLRPQLDAIRDAGRSGSAMYEIPWHKGLAMEVPWIRPSRTAIQLFVLSARRRRQARDWEGALEDTAAGLQLARDAAGVPLLIHYLVGNSLTFTVLDELYMTLQDPDLPPGTAARIADVLARADEERILPADVVESERALVNETMRDAVRNGRLRDIGEPEAMRFLLWRQGFSLRIAAADLDERYERVVNTLREFQTRPFSEAAPQYDALSPEGRGDNPLADLMMLSVANVDRSSREMRAKIRLLRAGFSEKAGRAIPLPDDPFDGKPLGRREEEGKVLLWSRWINGDQGGKGTWRTQDSSEPGDLVLEFSK
ncbi:MAG: hypothetical protein HYY18_07015 [Planctomycetes bacterium]|nr:hypothetical protein [Planctomycetota bacterium]